MSAYRLFLIMSGVNALALDMAFTLNLVYQVKVVGLGPLQLVLVGTVLELVLFVAQIPTGVIADLYSRRLSVVIGYALMAAGLLVWGLIPTYAAVLLANVIWAIGWTCVDGAQQAWAADEIGEASAGKAFVRAGQLAQVGALIGIVAAVGLSHWGLAVPIVAGGIVTLGLVALLIARMPEDNWTRPSTGASSAASAPPVEPGALPALPGTAVPAQIGGGPAGTGWASAVSGSFRSMREQIVAGSQEVRRSAMLAGLIGGTVFAGMASEGFDRLSQPHFLDDLHFPASAAPELWFGAFAMIAALGAALVTGIVGARVDTAHPRHVGRLLAIVEAVIAAGMIGFGLTGHFWLAVVLYLVVVILRESVEPLVSVWLVSTTTSATRATVFSIQSQADALGQIVGGPPIGLVAQRRGLGVGISAAGVFILPAVVLFALAARRSPVASMPDDDAALQDRS
ncbi:MFS transporter [Microlunatus ginsengisoli]|uniref:MFS transporter n=1 Tax=Microlunatus ginsengisoli TaxID=363863 RepID=A0ABP6ZEA7_9ACTN